MTIRLDCTACRHGLTGRLIGRAGTAPRSPRPPVRRFVLQWYPVGACASVLPERVAPYRGCAAGQLASSVSVVPYLRLVQFFFSVHPWAFTDGAQQGPRCGNIHTESNRRTHKTGSRRDGELCESTFATALQIRFQLAGSWQKPCCCCLSLLLPVASTHAHRKSAGLVLALR